MPTWYGTNTLVSNFQEMSETSPGADATSSPLVGWIHGTGNTNSAHMDAGTQVASTAFTSTTPPDGTLDGTTGDAFRTTNPYNGSFASANWTFTFTLIGVTQAGAQDGFIKFRMFRGPNADGSGATEITAGNQNTTMITNLSTTQQSSTATINPGAFSVTNEYIFVQVAWQRSGAGGMTTTDVNFRWGTTATRVVSSTFTPAPTPVFTQNQYRFYKDDGAANAATARANQNTNISMVADRNVRLRFNINAATNPPTQNTSFKLQVSKNSGAYADVNASSNDVRSSASTQFADGDATTELLSGAGTFNAGTMDEVDGAATGFTASPAAGQDTEIGFCFQVRSSDVAAGNTLDFRVVQTTGSTVLDSYTVTPRITVAANPNGEARIPLTDLSGTLLTGAATGTLNVLLKKEPNGALTPSANPTATIELRDGVAGGATVLKTLATNAAVSDTSADGALLSYTFDQSGISGAQADNAAVWITTTNIVGASVRILPLEWVAQITAGGGTTFPETHNASATVTATHQIQVTKLHTRSVTATPTHVKQVQKIYSRSVTGTPTHTKQAQKVHTQAATGSPSHAKQAQIRRSATVTGTPAHAPTKVTLRTHNATSSVSATHTKQVQKPHAASATAAVTHRRDVALVRAFVATATATHQATKVTLRSHNATATGAPTHATLKGVLGTHNASATGVATHTKQAQIRRSVTETAVATHVKQAQKIFAASATGTATSTSLKAFLRVHNASATANVTHLKQAQIRRTASATGTPTHASQAQIRRTHDRAATGTPTHVKQAQIRRSASATGTGTHAQLKVILRTHNASAVATPTHLKQAQIRRTANATGTPAHTKQVRLSRAATATGSATHAKEAQIRRVRSATGTPTHSGVKVTLRTHNVTATGTTTHRKQVQKVNDAVVAAVASHTRRTSLAHSVTETVTPTHSALRQAPPRLLTHNATAAGAATHSRSILLRHNRVVLVTPTHTYQTTIIDTPAPHRRARIVTPSGRVRWYSTPRAIVGNEGDYGGRRVRTY